MIGMSLKFEVISARIVDIPKSKKYVAYSVMVRYFRGSDFIDPHPAVIERRYNDFLALYVRIRREYPFVVAHFHFPKKVLIGNFNSDIISMRRACFERLLTLITSHNYVKNSTAVTSFFYDKDMSQAYNLLQMDLYEAAKPVVENIFWLLSKVCTDRTPALLRCLCLLVAITAKSRDRAALPLATLAIQRYQAVSDVDLLKYYVPLLHTAKEVSSLTGEDVTTISDHLEELKRKGINTKQTHSLLQIILDDINPISVPSQPSSTV